MRLTAASLGALKLDTDVTDKIFFDTDVAGLRSACTRQRSPYVDFSVQGWWKD
jgi:hypothetical protein